MLAFVTIRLRALVAALRTVTVAAWDVVGKLFRNAFTRSSAMSFSVFK
jgi:hypothetical protein